jgi:hypothetical protein
MTQETYKLMRSWTYGESMQPHEVNGIEYTGLKKAIWASEVHGGHVVRQSDGAYYMGADGWVDAYTGEPVAAEVK